MNNEEKIINISQSQMNQLVSQMNKANNNKFESIRMFTIISAVIIITSGYIFNNKLDEANKLTLESSKQLNLVLSQNEYMQKNIKALSGTVCYSCHNTNAMFLPKSKLSLTEFTNYVRGERFLVNADMPIFTEDMVSDRELQDMWKILY